MITSMGEIGRTRTPLTEVTLEELAERLDKANIEPDEVQKVVRQVNGLTDGVADKVMLADIDRAPLDARVKDLVALALLLRQVPLSENELGDNLKSTFEGLSERRPRFVAALEKRQHDPDREITPLDLPIKEQHVEPYNLNLHPNWRSELEEGEKPIGIIISGSHIFFELPPVDGRTDTQSVAGLKNLEYAATELLEEVLAAMPPLDGYQGLIKGLALTIESPMARVRDEITQVLNKRKDAQKSSAERLVGLVSPKAFDAALENANAGPKY